MPTFYPRTAASRIIKNTNLQYTGSGTVNTTTVFGPEVFFVRVFSQVGGWISIDNTTGTSISSSTGGTLIAANTAAGDFFSCTPGQSLAFSSSSTSSGTISVTEMS
jgi:hypothetical protein